MIGTLSDDVLERELRALYEDVVMEPLPPRFDGVLALLQQRDAGPARWRSFPHCWPSPAEQRGKLQ
jgi:hypothetical protein